MSNQPLVELTNICKYYSSGEAEVRALDGVDLTINQGEFLSILGPSGSGKSTLMNMLGCLDKPTDGEYQLGGQNVASLSANELAGIRNHKIGFVFQSFNLLEYATALDNVALPLVYSGIKAKERRQRAAKLLEQVGRGDRVAFRHLYDVTSPRLYGLALRILRRDFHAERLYIGELGAPGSAVGGSALHASERGRAAHHQNLAAAAFDHLRQHRP